MAETRPCALIPVYNHPGTIGAVCDELTALGLPVLLIDDGCDAPCAAVLDRLATQGHHLLRLEANRGKGAAVRAGLREAERLGYSHALQVDADGQHASEDLPAFLAALDRTPESLVIGYPRYDASVPRSRLYGRYLSHVWVWINTLSLAIRDSMCGVRLYPVAPLNRLLERHPSGDRMTFDTEALVRWYWAGGRLVNLPVRVHYPRDGISHFALWRDNRQITLMHTRLFFGMLLRSPRLLKRRLRQRREARRGQAHWANIGERGTLAGMTLMVAIQRHLGRWPFRLVLAPVILWYFLVHGTARRASQAFLTRLDPSLARRPLARLMRSYRHFLSFGDALMDKVEAWSGEIADERLGGTGMDDLSAAIAGGQGGIMLVAHHGNLDVVNAMAERHPTLDLTVMMHTRNAGKFNALLERVTGKPRPRVLEVSEITPATAQTLAERIGRGGFVVIAADRLPVRGGRSRPLAFLGGTAAFPEGPFWLAALLRCPLYLLACVRDGDAFQIDFAPFDDTRSLARQQRAAWLADAMQRYADQLARRVQSHPLQWFNFYPFWQNAAAHRDSGHPDDDTP